MKPNSPVRAIERKVWEPYKFVDKYGQADYSSDWHEQQASVEATRAMFKMMKPKGESIETI